MKQGWLSTRVLPMLPLVAGILLGGWASGG
jgi:hypothetical protein